MTKKYIKGLEEQNEELSELLADAQAFSFYWVKEQRVGTISYPNDTADWWYLKVGKNTILAVVHYVRDVKVDGFKVCVLDTPMAYTSACNVEAGYIDVAMITSLEDAKKYCENRILNG
jgi:hypothetical protein